MVAIGNVKLGMRIEPIYVHELSREEVDRILQANGISLNQDVGYPIDTSIISSFRTDRRKLKEYIEICKYAFDKKNGLNVQKPNAKKLSIFDDELQISYELKHLKESESMSEAEKVSIYKQAKATQNLFRMFGASNINLEISLLDRAYFSVQSLLQTIKTRGKLQYYQQQKRRNQESLEKNFLMEQHKGQQKESQKIGKNSLEKYQLKKMK